MLFSVGKEYHFKTILSAAIKNNNTKKCPHEELREFLFLFYIQGWEVIQYLVNCHCDKNMFGNIIFYQAIDFLISGFDVLHV